MKYVDSRQIVSIVLMVVCLVGVIVMKSRCGTSVENMFRALSPPPPTPQTKMLIISDGGGARD